MCVTVCVCVCVVCVARACMGALLGRHGMSMGRCMACVAVCTSQRPRSVEPRSAPTHQIPFLWALCSFAWLNLRLQHSARSQVLLFPACSLGQVCHQAQSGHNKWQLGRPRHLIFLSCCSR